MRIYLLFFLISALKNDPSEISQEEKTAIESILSILPTDKERKMEDVFKHLFFFDQFSYPLFGTKPMSIACLLPTNKTRIGWDAWKKIAPFFCSEKFIIRDFVFNNHEFVLVANLEEVEKIYNENKSLFEQSFKGITLEILKKCLKEESSLFQELMHNHLILGILLGYGRKNAELFSNNQNLGKEGKFPLESFSSGHPIFYYFSSVAPVYFACDPNSDETKDLKKRYKAERAAIIKMAKKESLFTRMLILLKNGD